MPTLAASVHLTPEERQQLGQSIGRLIAAIGRWLHLPWWATVLLLAGIVAGLVGLGYAHRRLIRRARIRQAAERRRVAALNLVPAAAADKPTPCGHCGRPTASSAYIRGRRLCHTGAWFLGDMPDCYRLVVEGAHQADGACCREAAG